MSRFNSTAYDKLFPRVNDPVPAPESSVDTFRPSQEKKEDPAEEKSVPDATDPESESLGGDPDGDGEHSKPDIE